VSSCLSNKSNDEAETFYLRQTFDKILGQDWQTRPGTILLSLLRVHSKFNVKLSLALPKFVFYFKFVKSETLGTATKFNIKGTQSLQNLNYLKLQVQYLIKPTFYEKERKNF
jgi:hypothetical protein